MTQLSPYLIFRLDAQRCALPLEVVDRVLGAAEITPLPQAPGVVLGVLDLGGEVRPVLSLRQRFRRPERPVQPADHFLLAQAGPRPVVLMVDSVEGVRHLAAGAIVPPQGIAPGLEMVRGVAVLPDGLVLIHDLETFLSLDEAAALDAAMEVAAPHGN
jgi:purine-binding chemotaxis protein CheW